MAKRGDEKKYTTTIVHYAQQAVECRGTWKKYFEFNHRELDEKTFVDYLSSFKYFTYCRIRFSNRTLHEYCTCGYQDHQCQVCYDFGNCDTIQAGCRCKSLPTIRRCTVRWKSRHTFVGEDKRSAMLTEALMGIKKTPIEMW